MLLALSLLACSCGSTPEAASLPASPPEVGSRPDHDAIRKASEARFTKEQAAAEQEITAQMEQLRTSWTAEIATTRAEFEPRLVALEAKKAPEAADLRTAYTKFVADYEALAPLTGQEWDMARIQVDMEWRVLRGRMPKSGSP